MTIREQATTSKSLFRNAPLSLLKDSSTLRMVADLYKTAAMVQDEKQFIVDEQIYNDTARALCCAIRSYNEIIRADHLSNMPL